MPNIWPKNCMLRCMRSQCMSSAYPLSWDGMPILSIRHVTTYHYSQPVAFGAHRMMLRPRDDEDQKVIETELEITPRPRQIAWSQDSFGNHVATAELCSPIYDPHPATLDRRIRESGETFPEIQSAIYRDNAASELRLIIVWLEVRVLSAPPRSPAQTGISRFSANRPELAAICARILSLQSADWIAGTVSRSLSLPWKIAFPDGEDGLGRDSVRMLGQCDGKPSTLPMWRSRRSSLLVA